MQNYLVTFSYQGQLEKSLAHDYIDGKLIKDIIELLRAGGVAMIDWQKVFSDEIDHPAEPDEPILENHTLFEIRLEVNDSDNPEEAIDWHDGGDDLFHYVLDALELGEPEITYFYTIGDEPMQKSIIGIDIHSAQ